MSHLITQLPVQIDSTQQTHLHLFAQADDHAGPVGLLVLGLEEGENAGWISSVFIDPDYRRRGVAKDLLEWAFTACREKGLSFVSLSVKTENVGAQQLYKSLGFTPFMNGAKDYLQYIKVL